MHVYGILSLCPQSLPDPFLLLLLPKCMGLHFVVLNGNCHNLDHVSTSFCNNFDSSELFTPRYTFVSSANSFVMLVKSLVKSLMYITNSSGPSTVPCGMPLITFSREDGFPSTATLCFLLLKMIVSTAVCHLLFTRHLLLKLVSYVIQSRMFLRSRYILC